MLDTEIPSSITDHIELLKEIKHLATEKAIDLLEKSFPGQFTREENIKIVQTLKDMTESELNVLVKETKQTEYSAQDSISKRGLLKYLQSRPIEQFLQALKIYSRAIRNCDQIEDLSYRKTHLIQCLRYWAKSILSVLREQEAAIEKKLGSEGKFDEYSEEQKKEARIFDRIFAFNVFQSLVSVELGSDKLENLLDKGMNDLEQDAIVLFLFTLIYSDLRLPSYVGKLRQLAGSLKGKYFPLVLLMHRLILPISTDIYALWYEHPRIQL